MRLLVPAILFCMFVLVAAAMPVSARKPTIDDFPQDLRRYVVGGWQGPYGDGTGGTVTVTSDGSGIYLDGTVNALAYAIRKGAPFSDLSIRATLAVVNQDAVEAEQFSFLLRWRDPIFTGQSSCPPCLDPLVSSGIVVNFNLGRNALRVTEVSNYIGVELVQVPMSYPAGGSHEVRMDYIGDSLTVFIDDAVMLSMTGLPDPAGQVGFMAYRVDITVDSVSIERM